MPVETEAAEEVQPIPQRVDSDFAIRPVLLGAAEDNSQDIAPEEHIVTEQREAPKTIGDLIEVVLNRKCRNFSLERAVEPFADRGLFTRNGGQSAVSGRHCCHRGDRIVPPPAVGTPDHPIVNKLILQKKNQSVLTQAG